MASNNTNVKIKREEDCSEDSHSSSTTPANVKKIDVEDLEDLSPRNAARRKYPPGCPVWYELAPSGKCLDGRQGVVKSVYISFESDCTSFVYEVVGGAEVMIDESSSSSPDRKFLWEDQLSFAMNCPVKVKGGMSVEDDQTAASDRTMNIQNKQNSKDSDELEGIILCPKPGKGDRKLSYTVRTSLGGNRFRVELGVESERISYRVVEKQEERVTTSSKKEAQDQEVGDRKTVNFNDSKDEKKSEQVAQGGSQTAGELKDSIMNDGVQSNSLSNALGNNMAVDEGKGADTATKQADATIDAISQNARGTTTTNTKDESQHDASKEDEHTDKDSSSSSIQSGAPHAHNKRFSATTAPAAASSLPKVSLHDRFEKCSSKPLSTATATKPNNSENKRLCSAKAAKQSEQSNGTNHLRLAVDQHIPPSSLPIVTPKVGGSEKTPLLKPPANVYVGGVASVPSRDSDEKGSSICRKRWEPPSTGDNLQQQQHQKTENYNDTSAARHMPPPTLQRQHNAEGYAAARHLPPPASAGGGVFCRLTVPMWVTDSSHRILFHHINEVMRTHRLGSETGCTVDMSYYDKDNATLMYLTIRPTKNRFDMVKAKEILEDALLDFVDCDGAKARLHYELALSLDGASHLQSYGCDGIVQQRNHKTNNEIVWMKLIDVPMFNPNDILAFNIAVQNRVQHKMCSVEVYSQSLNMELSAKFCKPFALICGKTSEVVGVVTKLVTDVLKEHQQQFVSHREELAIHADFCRLTLPFWVTDSTVRSIFNHIVGLRDNGEKGHKTREIERETGCRVSISHMDRVNNVPLYITIQPMPSTREAGRFDITRAREMVEDSLLEFLHCSGSRARLVYEMAISLEGASNLLRAENGVVQQRGKTNEIVWMNLLNLPSTFKRNDILPFNEDVTRRLEDMKGGCSGEAFGNDLDNMKLPLELCKPCVLICGKSSDAVGEATKLVSNVINKYQQRQETKFSLGKRKPPPADTIDLPSRERPSKESKLSRNEEQNNAHLLGNNDEVSPGKRRPLPDDTGSLPSRERSTRASKFSKNKEQNAQLLRNNDGASCILTVPLWVTPNHSQGQELFRHLKGYCGANMKAICSKTKCAIKLSEDGTPLVITIKSNYGRGDVELAKRMITKSLIEFLDDDASEARLIYELALTAKGTFVFEKVGNAVQQECQLENVLVWMTLLELPSADFNGTLTPHGRFFHDDSVQQCMKGNTGCFLEVYGFYHLVPELSGPYVMVVGDDPDEVNEVAARVDGKISEHLQRCPNRCQLDNF